MLTQNISYAFFMEKFINSLPKPVLAILAILVGIIVIMILNPPHSVCDTQAETFKELQMGNIFPIMEKKNKLPPTLTRAKEACQLGNSAGSCYEYFMVLKKVADDISKSSSECFSQLYGMKEVRSAMNDGIELMVRLAWGIHPPEPGLERFGWLQEADIAVFCRIKNVYLRANGEEAWSRLRQSVAAKLPGEEVPFSTEPGLIAAPARVAKDMMTEQDIWNRSLFSVRCDGY